MKAFNFYKSDMYYLNGNKFLDYNKEITLEPKEVEVLNVTC
jgi:hypothetical protein